METSIKDLKLNTSLDFLFELYPFLSISECDFNLNNGFPSSSKGDEEENFLKAKRWTMLSRKTRRLRRSHGLFCATR